MRPLLAITAICLLFCSVIGAAEKDDVFGLTRLHTVEVTVSPSDYAAMESPPVNPFGGGRPTGGGPNRPAPGSPDFGAGSFGFEFKYVPAAIQLDGQKFAEVGLRYKGNGTYMMSQRQAKRSVKIDFDRFDEKQSWSGLKKLNLNSGVMDPTGAREVLAYSVFKAAGIPAPRTALAQLTLTVPGKYSKEHLGIYTVVEQFDKKFLKTHFNSAKGLLLKPEGIRGLPHFGNEAKNYEETYQPKEVGNPEQWSRLMELTRLINKADEAEFQKKVGDYLDTDSFASFLAVNTLLASHDGFIGHGHNYYLYLSPETGRFVFFPWDLDLAFGSFPFMGTPQQLADLSIDHPHSGDNKLIDRLLAMPEWKELYRMRLRQLTTELFASGKLAKDVTTLEELLKPLRAKDKAAAEARKEGPAGFGPGGGIFGAAPLGLTTFIEKRTSSVLDQLDGKGKGYVPQQMNFGPPGGGPGGGLPVGPILAKPLIHSLDADRDGKLSEEEAVSGLPKLIREWDKDASGALDERELAEGLQRLVPTPGPMPRPMRPRP